MFNCGGSTSSIAGGWTAGWTGVNARTAKQNIQRDSARPDVRFLAVVGVLQSSMMHTVRRFAVGDTGPGQFASRQFSPQVVRSKNRSQDCTAGSA